MHPGKEAEALLLGKTTDEDREKALVWAVLALSDSIDGLGHDVREAGRDIATELGGISVTLGNIADGLPK